MITASHLTSNPAKDIPNPWRNNSENGLFSSTFGRSSPDSEDISYEVSTSLNGSPSRNWALFTEAYATQQFCTLEFFHYRFAASFCRECFPSRRELALGSCLLNHSSKITHLWQLGSQKRVRRLSNLHWEINKVLTALECHYLRYFRLQSWHHSKKPDS